MQASQFTKARAVLASKSRAFTPKNPTPKEKAVMSLNRPIDPRLVGLGRRRGGGLMDMARKGVSLAQEHGLDDDAVETDPAKMMAKMGPMIQLMKQMKQAEGGRRQKTRRGKRSLRRRRATRKH